MLPGPESDPTSPGEDWMALKGAVRRFENAWRQGPRPRLDDYLPADVPLRARVLIELAHIDLELRLKAGEAARVEDYLARYAELTGDRAATLELIAAEHELRRRREPGLDLEQYLQRFQRPPFDQLHAEKRPAGGLPGVENGADVRVIQGTGGQRLAPEALQPRGLPGTLPGQEL